MLPITRNTKAEALLCPIRQILARVTGKWQVLILLALEDEALRFGQVKRAIGDVTQRVLTENLRRLERDGYLTRTVDGGPPVAVSYELTPMGHSFIETLKPLVFWARDNFPNVTEARGRYDAQAET